jgi:hypothetical protein
MKYSWRSGQRLYQSGPRCQSDLVLGDVQYPTAWFPVGLTAAVVVGAAVWPGDRFTRVVIALCLIALMIVGYFLLPNVFDVDQLIRE